MIALRIWKHLQHAFRAFTFAVAITIVAAPLAAQDDVASYIARIEGRQTPDRQGLDGYTVAELLQRFHVPGISVAVIKDFKIHWAKAYGIADVETNRMVDTGTLFQAASISKPVTAFAAARLVQEGKFTFDTDVNQLLKSWKVPRNEKSGTQPVTIRSLFSHTSGADDGFGFPGYAPDDARPTLAQIFNGEKPSNVGAVIFTRPPYAAYKYSGGGLTIMQLALTEFTGMPFADFMQRYVLGPVGMGNSSYEQPISSSMATRTARAHGGNGKSMGPKWHVYPEQAAAGLWTTPSDLARFAIVMQLAVAGTKTQVLSQAMAREMTAPVGVGPFAVGLQMQKRGEGWYFSHSGGNWGFSCNMVAHLRNGYGFVIMTNSDAGGPIIAEFEARVAAAYGWDLLDKALLR